jgi:hypothetical protein
VKSKYGLVCAAACVLAAAATSSTARAESAPKESEKDHAERGIRLGVLGGVGFPRPLAVEGVFELDRILMIGGEYSALPQTTISGAQTSLWALAADARIFPARNGFFLGVRVGRQHLEESASITVTGVGTFSGSNTADTTFINPRMGFLWSLGPVALGIDAGVQIPLSTSASSTVPAGVTQPQSVTDVNHALTGALLPTVDLLRLGVVL